MAAFISVSCKENEMIIHVSGWFNSEIRSEFEQVYRKVIQEMQKCNHFTLDLSATEHIDSSAIGMLVLMYQEIGREGPPVKIINTSGHVNKLLRITGLDRLFEIPAS
ncbi:MAG: STAS domain-containing protein [Magnetococcales bacterium]|nr:STAS domain-containing protein [Magnetococcales bacterium]MBF0114646.1 STAS domain-containing protein [Magnetococcales bacterium]